MTTWPGAAGLLADGVDRAVSAARRGDAELFAEALVKLRRVDPEQLSVVLGTLARDLVERVHPDGLDGDDAEQLLTGCFSASAWYPALDGNALVRAFADTLGIDVYPPATDGDDDASPVQPAPTVDPDAVRVHGLLLITELLSVSGLRLTPVLDAALGELMRAQTVEMP